MGRKQEQCNIFSGSLEELFEQLNGAVLVAIDTENLHRKKKPDIEDRQVGLAILDLSDASANVETHNFVSGSAGYCARATPRFLFGESIKIEKSEIGQNVESVYPSSQDIILVGHALHAELRMLEVNNMTLPFKCIIDTQRLAQDIMPTLSQGPSLNRLGNLLNIPMPYRQSAGNDAYYTLVALLGVICYKAPPEVHVESWRNMSIAFERSRSHIQEIKQPMNIPPKPPSPRKLREQVQWLKYKRDSRNLMERQRKAVRACRAFEREQVKPLLFWLTKDTWLYLPAISLVHAFVENWSPTLLV